MIKSKEIIRDMGIIQMVILYIAVYLLFMIFRWVILPHLPVFPHIPPQLLWVTLHKITLFITHAIFNWILAVLVVLYIIWIIIKKYVPNFPIPFKLICLIPFRPLEASGILPLIDNIANTLFSAMPFKDRIRSAGDAFAKYMITSTSYILKDVNVQVKLKPDAEENAAAPASTPTPPEAKDTDPDTAFFNKEIEEEYALCVEENTAPVTADMNGISKAAIMAKNNTAKVQCQLQGLQAQTRMLQYKDL